MTRTMRLLLIVPISLFVGGHLLGAGASAAIGTDLATALVVGFDGEAPAAGSAEGLLTELFRQSPLAAALVAMFVLFIRDRAANDKLNREERKANMEMIDQRSKECHASQREVAKAIHENTNATWELRHSIERDGRRSTTTMPKPSDS